MDPFFRAISPVKPPQGHPSRFSMISAFRGKRFLPARCSSPPAHKPRAGRQRRYPTPSPAAPLLSLPTRGLPRFRHVPVFSWLVSKDLAAFQKAKSAEVGGASERASSPSPRPRRPTGTLLPLPLGGAAAASGVGSPGRLPASPRSPTPPVAALLSLHRRTGGDAGVCSAPAPSLFLSFQALGSCCRSRERLYREQRRAKRPGHRLPRRRANRAGRTTSQASPPVLAAPAGM